jgi:hypothetical protein
MYRIIAAHRASVVGVIQELGQPRVVIGCGQREIMCGTVCRNRISDRIFCGHLAWRLQRAQTTQLDRQQSADRSDNTTESRRELGRYT